MKAERQMNMANDKMTLLEVDEVDRGQAYSSDRNDETQGAVVEGRPGIFPSSAIFTKMGGFRAAHLEGRSSLVISHPGLLALGNRNAAMEFRIGGRASEWKGIHGRRGDRPWQLGRGGPELIVRGAVPPALIIAPHTNAHTDQPLPTNTAAVAAHHALRNATESPVSAALVGLMRISYVFRARVMRGAGPSIPP